MPSALPPNSTSGPGGTPGTPSAIRQVLLDIEGTTCPVAFVSEVLFPYSSQALPAYLAQHGREPELQPLLQDLLAGWREETDPEARELLMASPFPALPDGAAAGALDAQALIPYLRWLIRTDRKVTAWKDLQGRLWQEGYDRGALQATLFPEVPATLQRWQQQGLQLSVYSSGSVAAQKLLYGHSQAGDLCPLFRHWFDTRIGAKQEPASYSAILRTLGCGAAEVLFISDALPELQAAAAIGMAVLFSDRPGNPGRDAAGFPVICRLDAVDPLRWPHPLAGD